MLTNRLSLTYILILASLTCLGSDSAWLVWQNSSINFQQYREYRAQQQAAVENNFPTFHAEEVSPSIQVPQTLQPFMDEAEIESACTEAIAIRKSAHVKKIKGWSRQLAFWKGWDAYKKKPVVKDEHWGKLRNHDSKVWKKVWRGEMLIGGAELVGMGILMMLPKDVTKWPDDWVADAGRNINRAYSNPPVIDEDDWQMNYVGHPLAGSLYYNTIRSQNATWFQSFLFSTAQSVIWEYLVEGIAEQPSVQDLIITPISGSILGEACHQLTMSMRRNGFSFGEKVVTILLNPMFVVNNGFGPRHNPPRIK
ncbi:MAG TPA: DUF3943 domain-containing protein [Phnomibacter sp.]|nr:DUF3943 domain-containing protein [Phnomibacter sp.]